MTDFQLSRAELETARNPQEMSKWVQQTLDKIALTLEGRNQIRLRKGLLKELADEALPISLFAEKYFGDSRDIQIQHIIGSQTYDAKILYRNDVTPDINYIEVTQAREGEAEYLRMLKLQQDGAVPALGDVKKSGTKNTGIQFEVSYEAKTESEILENTCSFIQASITRKSKKSYPEGTVLLVSFNDFHTFHWDDERESLSQALNTETIIESTAFRMVVVIGWSGHIYLQE